MGKKDANTTSIRNKGLSRRAFLGEALAAGIGLAGAASLAGCAPTAQTDPASEHEPNATRTSLGEAAQTVEADVLVVGAGAAGMMAAYEAGKAGAKTIVISNSPNALSTNGSLVSGTCAVETSHLAERGQTTTTDELYRYMMQFINGMPNARLLKSCVSLLPSNIDIFSDMGIEVSVGADRYDIGFEEVHLFATEGKGQIMEDYIATNYDVQFTYDTEAREPLMENGICVGAKALQGDAVIDYRAKSVVLACGGFLFDDEQMNRSFGCEVVKLSSEYQTGWGIKIAEQAGAYRESIDTLGLSDVVGANKHNGFNLQNPACMPALYGGLLVDPQGNRFMNEYDLAMASMSYGGEPLLHVKEYYAIFDEAGIQANTQEGGYYQYMGNPDCWMSGKLLYATPH